MKAFVMKAIGQVGFMEKPMLIVRPPDLLDKSKVTWDAATLSAIQG